MLAQGFKAFTQLELQMLKDGYKPEDTVTYAEVKREYKTQLGVLSLMHALTKEGTVVAITTKGVGYKIYGPAPQPAIGATLLEKAKSLFTIQTPSNIYLPAYM